MTVIFLILLPDILEGGWINIFIAYTDNEICARGGTPV